MNTTLADHRTPRRTARAVSLLAAAASGPVHAADAWVLPDRWFVYAIVIAVLGASVLSLLLIRSALIASTWSFSDALSEPTDITGKEADASGVLRMKLDSEGKPLVVTEMRASSSRVIALMGTIVILMMFLGFGAISLFSFASTGTVPESLDQVVHFMLAGLTLFAPYAVNKFSKMFENIWPKKS